MKKFAALVLVGVLVFAALGMFTTGSASAGGASYAPLAAATATPAAAPDRVPVAGGEADLSGAMLLLAAGGLLVLGGLALRTARQPRA